MAQRENAPRGETTSLTPCPSAAHPGYTEFICHIPWLCSTSTDPPATSLLSQRHICGDRPTRRGPSPIGKSFTKERPARVPGRSMAARVTSSSTSISDSHNLTTE